LKVVRTRSFNTGLDGRSRMKTVTWLCAWSCCIRD